MQNDGKYRLDGREGNDWKDYGELVPCEDKDYEDHFTTDRAALQPIGLKSSSGEMFLFKVTKGTKTASHEFTGGYYLFSSLLVQGDLYKVR